jgi:type IV pilus assembly protein PilM
LGIEAQQAEEYKKTYGLSSAQLEGRIKGVLDPVLRMVSDEMKKAIHYYQAEGEGDSPKTLVISGGTSGMPDVTGVLTSLTNMEVLVGNPFLKVSLDPEAAKALMGYAQVYSIAVGLAMRG